jgi:hypothetical protein
MGRCFRSKRFRFFRNTLFHQPYCAAFEGPTSARTLVVLAVIASLADSKTTSKTLAILLFLGVAVVVLDGFDNPVTVGGISTFGCSTAFSGSSSFIGPVLASIDIAGAVYMAEGATSTLSISFGTLAVPIGFGLHVRTLALFGFDALEEVEVATFLFPPCLRIRKQ